MFVKNRGSESESAPFLVHSLRIQVARALVWEICSSVISVSGSVFALQLVGLLFDVVILELDPRAGPRLNDRLISSDQHSSSSFKKKGNGNTHGLGGRRHHQKKGGRQVAPPKRTYRKNTAQRKEGMGKTTPSNRKSRIQLLPHW